ncbi:hypothetical protein CspeluHIS016_0105820 [Cutaneotrichosporon spelunceum]|uniref:Pentatricopeptide repeat-containing protein-mitochondrial domain-containing protein n=1 Tax=Cutaneotrichosporon spelunceum TaxID=1672016 RepID=A0AAD3TNA0_9TREE|nr:hypothetical protein CspeluHIS016_0105820 [Cutaneotrichosporon spelunceum]
MSSLPHFGRFARAATITAPSPLALATARFRVLSTAVEGQRRSGGGGGYRGSRSNSRHEPRSGGSRGPVVPPNNLAQLLNTFATLKAEGRKPTAAAYTTLIKEAANYGTRRGNNAGAGELSLGFEIALGAMRDADAGGIELGIESLNELLRFSILHPEILPSLLLEFAKRQATTVETYDTLAAHALLPGRVEEVMMILVEMLEQNMAPNQNIVRNAIRLLCEWGQSRLAIDLVHRIQDVPGQREVASESWVQILMAAADQQDLPTVEAAWDRVVNVKAYTPDEGLILSVLAVAARWGKPALATRALAALSDLGVSKKEHHLVPLVEAFCRDGRVPDAIEAVGLIREGGLTPTLSTVRPIVEVLRTAEIIDQAFYCLEDRVKEGKPVDVAVFNALIQASAKIGDLQRARATQLAAEELEITPDLETFNTVLSACAAAKHTKLAETVLGEMEAAGFPPSEATYESMIRLALSQPEYEDAFYYLEKMKADGIKPAREIYKQIGMKCVAVDDKRHALVADEMESIGYGKPDFVSEMQRKRERQARGRARDNQRRERGQRNEGRREQSEREQRDRRKTRTREHQVVGGSLVTPALTEVFIFSSLVADNMQSLAEECTPLKQRYDACFNLWFEGYLQPALDAAGVRRPLMSGVPELNPSSSSSSSSAASPSPSSEEELADGKRRLITSWAYSSAFRSRVMPTPAPADDMVGASHVHFGVEEEEGEPMDTEGMTRAQIKAAQYERQCGKVWKDYQRCLRKAIEDNQNLTQLLDQARDEHPLHTMDGLEGTAWDPSTKGAQ